MMSILMIISYVALCVLALLVSALMCYWFFSSLGLLESNEAREFMEAEDRDVE